MTLSTARYAAAALFGFTAFMTGAQAADPHELHARQASDSVIAPLMEKYRIPGMAVGVVSAGKSYVFNYGAASLQPRKPVTDQTLFELGSISKTLTATMTSYAQVEGKLSLDDKVEKYLPALRGSAFGQVRLLDLGTHTPGGLPLQLPDGIGNEAQLMDYYKAWKPSYPAGTQRTYANPGIGLLGLITARSMHEDFTRIMEKRIFPALDMQHSFIKVPAKRMGDYAQGYNKEDKPTRMKGDALAPQAYGVKSTAADMLAFMRANMNPSLLEDTLSRAISGTHVGYYRTAQFTQDLIWEQYAYPVSLPTLLEGNSTKVIMEPTPVTAITPPQAARNDVWINKTGSTNGFGAYVAFIPARGIGIVMLANRNFPIDARVTAAHDILTALTSPQ